MVTFLQGVQTLEKGVLQGSKTLKSLTTFLESYQNDQWYLSQEVEEDLGVIEPENHPKPPTHPHRQVEGRTPPWRASSAASSTPSSPP